MIQPLGTSQTQWAITWEEAATPTLLGDTILLPVTVHVFEGTNGEIITSSTMPELEQPIVENVLVKLFGQFGTPDEIFIPRSKYWDIRGWKAFSKEFHTKVKLIKLNSQPTPLILRQAVASTEKLSIQENKRAMEKLSSYSAGEIAEALTFNARRIRDPKKQRQMLEKAIEIHPDCSVAYLELADIELHSGAITNAARYFEKVEHIEYSRWEGKQPDWWVDPETRVYLRALHGMMLTAWNTGAFEQALESGSLLLDTNPTDHQGLRFSLPLIHLLAERHDSALTFYQEYEKNYPGDMHEPGFLFGWGLTLSLDGEEKKSRFRYLQGMLRNIYIAPMLMELEIPGQDIWHPSDRSEPEYAFEFVDSFRMLWERDPSSLRFLKECFLLAKNSIDEVIALRTRMAQAQDQRYDPHYSENWNRLVKEERMLCEKFLAIQ